MLLRRLFHLSVLKSTDERRVLLLTKPRAVTKRSYPLAGLPIDLTGHLLISLISDKLGFEEAFDPRSLLTKIFLNQ
jgi:hypothetical protein